ncbi:hypothetical protein [Sinomonas sp. ASV322]|uniref:IS1096 element passenger TnpR family protein n=1 Tax=Sinomonas sp. ASV322 TaxID=3041920 RepID=UPI0027DAB7A8|nr:hypothetical protein [Sinomonas sp. ASV322]MDQ4504081.1 hypothetical protein [Sinomonas sp. ASV322]
MAKTWLSIRVELIGGRGEQLWPRPGRIFAASTAHTLLDLATAIDIAFARWDHAHQHEFEFADGTRAGIPDPDFPELADIDTARTSLRKITTGELFTYTFDFGDQWTHQCAIDPRRIDPLDVLGIVPASPTPYWGWGSIPDQYGRRWDDDDGTGDPPEPPTGGRSLAGRE